MTTKEKIAVMQAYEDGKKIQQRIKCRRGKWNDTISPLWDWVSFDYRIKPEEEKPKRMTNRQLAEWCMKRNGQVKWKDSGMIFFDYSYHESHENDLVNKAIRIRPLGSDDWIEPTVDIYERDCKGN